MTQMPSLADILQPEQVGPDLFRAAAFSGDAVPTRLFGGQVIAQCLAAARHSVSAERRCHSIHSYFLRAGDPNQPLIFRVENARDGGSFSTRRVIATQGDQQILNFTGSFHVPDEGWDYQHEKPDAPGPQDCAPDQSTATARSANGSAEADNRRIHQTQFEILDVDPRNEANPVPGSDRHGFWFRIPAAENSNASLQQLYLTYASDMGLMSVGLRAHGLSWSQNTAQGASLDHAIWLHAPARLQDWHFYAMDGPWTGSGRGLARGMIFSEDGKLVASTAQESLLRRKRN
ncbi:MULTISPECIES: acyl-CoA thioesterase II [unclassified Ruegeria]|uniref:acyl-CoA thioesterase n=1 Tax=unclassified Ruegeria TaxID=2625375 RepID=UPI0014898402|nr:MULTISPECIES: acyl-CoA thioesterase domain-containing protein [unclassified Ruegeria]